MSRVEVDSTELFGISAARLHERQRTIDFGRPPLIALPAGLLDKVLVPAHAPGAVTAYHPGGTRAHKVERRT